MKATGIIRRIDDLGRVVVPKEIRRAMRIKEGDPLEIFTTNEGEIIFKKYEPFEESEIEKAIELLETLDIPVPNELRQALTDVKDGSTTHDADLKIRLSLDRG